MGKRKEVFVEEAGNPYAYTVAQNLKDAGCTDEMVREFLSLREDGEEEKQIELLMAHRRRLLERVHKEEKRIDCLDYLVYQIEKKQ